MRVVSAFAYLDLHEWYMRRTPFGDGTSPTPGFFSSPLRDQVLLSWMRAFHSGFTMALGYYLLAAILVGTGISSPQSWPSVYDSFIKKGYTMRNIWGSCW